MLYLAFELEIRCLFLSAVAAVLHVGKAAVSCLRHCPLAGVKSRWCLMHWRCTAGGRDAAGLLPLLQCLGKFLCDPRYSRLLLGLAHRVLDAYSGEVRPVLNISHSVFGLSWEVCTVFMCAPSCS